jgi:hypothetical protein
MSYSYDRSKTAAVDKVPVFDDFDVNLSTKAVEAMVKEHYEIEEGSLKFQKGVAKSGTSVYINFTYKTAGKDADNAAGGSGAVIMQVENNGNSIRCVAFVNIDG